MQATELTRNEQTETLKVRNAAVRYYAEKAFTFANIKAKGFLGRKVKFFRSDINYPDGAHVTGTAHQYSTICKKWLVSYDFCPKIGKKLNPSWVNLTAKECNPKFLTKEKNKEGTVITELDICPYMFGYTEKGDKDGSSLSLSPNCSACSEEFEVDSVNLVCGTCCKAYHPGCLDPPMTVRAAEKIMDESECWLCPKCRACKGCCKLDIAFGTRLITPKPSSLFLENGETLELCSTCVLLYDNDRFCPDCGHCWDDVKYQRTQKLLRWQSKITSLGGVKARSTKKPKNEDASAVTTSSVCHLSGGEVEFTEDDVNAFEDVPSPSSIEPSWFYPESSVWGYNEGAMLICDSCNLWVHAGCAGLTRSEYNQTNRGKHPIYSKEFLCRICSIRRCKFLVAQLQKQDTIFLFASPVTEQMAPNYRDVIKHPMDLQTMMEKANGGGYHNYAWIRDLSELMVWNALTFNSHNSKFWAEAKRYYTTCLEDVFSKYGKAAPPGRYHNAVKKSFADAELFKALEIERMKKDETAEKKDLIGGAHVKSVELSPLVTPPDPESCISFAETQLNSGDAFFCSWMDSCFVCGSSGAADAMLFCVDCGEAYHSFCANAPIHSMTAAAVSGWRCPNCKICEISGDLPEDESKLLFCEMCDRALTLTELDPPLKAVPSGLFICGQCVDCKSCGNRGEKQGMVSLRYWSRDPHKCFRCGGCKGLVERLTKGKKCPCCSTIWRNTDTDVVKCKSCERSIHSRCDKRAEEILTEGETGRTSRTRNISDVSL